MDSKFKLYVYDHFCKFLMNNASIISFSEELKVCKKRSILNHIDIQLDSVEDGPTAIKSLISSAFSFAFTMRGIDHWNHLEELWKQICDEVILIKYNEQLTEKFYDSIW